MNETNLPLLVAGLAFALAFVFGAVANRVNFCTMGAIVDIANVRGLAAHANVGTCYRRGHGWYWCSWLRLD